MLNAMKEEDLKTEMVSRLGRACNENIRLVDRAQHIVTEDRVPGESYYASTRAKCSFNIKDFLRENGMLSQDQEAEEDITILRPLAERKKKKGIPPVFTRMFYHLSLYSQHSRNSL